MRRFMLLLSALLLSTGVAAAQDYFVFSDYNTGQSGSYGPTGFVGSDGVDRIIYYSGSTAHIATVTLPPGSEPNMHPDNPEATGPVAPRTFTEELTFNLGVTPGHESEFYVTGQGAVIYLGASVGIRKYVWNGATYVYAGSIAPSPPIGDGYSTQSLAFDPGTNTWYAGAIAWNWDPGTTQRTVYKYAGMELGGTWEVAFTYTTAQGTSDHHDGMEFLNGHLFLADYQGNAIYEYTTAGELIRTYTHAPLSHELEGMGFGALNHFWVGSHGSTITEFGGGALQNAPPVAEAGPPVTVTALTVGSTELAGSATDPDSDAMTFRWLEGSTVITDWAPVLAGACPLPLSMAGSLSIGDHVFTLEVSDGQATASDQVTVTVSNAAPSCVATGGGTFEVGTGIVVGGQVADPDGDLLTYTWFDGALQIGTGTIQAAAGGVPVSLSPFTAGTLPVGSHNLTLQVSDGINAPVSSSALVTIVDTQAPTVIASVDQGILWPPDHTMRTVHIQTTTSDIGGQVTLTATIVSSEPDNGLGDGDTAGDIGSITIDQTTGLITVQLRAERSGTGSGRIYTILITATDASGNASTATAMVLVPKSSKVK